MKNTKIEVPEEFSVFLEDAVSVVSGYDKQGRDIGAITNDIAKFRYYLRGRKDELQEMIGKADQKRSAFKDDMMDKLISIEKLEGDLNTLFDALFDEDTSRN